MSTEKGNPVPRDIVAWVGFEANSAVLRRVIVPNGMKGLLLRTALTDEGRQIQERAEAFGFKALKTPGVSRMLFPDGRVPYSPRQLADVLGGKLIALARAEMLAEPWTINLSSRMPVTPQDAPADTVAKMENDRPVTARAKAPKPVMPDPETISVIGLNFRGEEVVRDRTGRFFRKVDEDGEAPVFIAESPVEQASLFLRATRLEDMSDIAAGLLRMAGRGTLHMADFDRVIDAAIEPGPAGPVDIDRATAVEIVRSEMLRQIGSVAIDNDASRERFLMALRLAENAGYVLSRRTAEGEMLSASPAMIAFMRRVTRNQPSVDFRGSDDLALSVPRTRKNGSALQVQDISGIDGNGALVYAMNVLSRRPESGMTIFIVDGEIGSDDIERFRADIGVAYAIESVAEFAPAIIDGVQGGRARCVFAIGARRPEALEVLPQAAMRSFRVIQDEDLVALEREIVRARNKIEEFNAGHVAIADEIEDSRVENSRQRPYQPLSDVCEPFTMIPAALEGATSKALDRVRRAFEDRGGMDAVVAAAMGLDVGSLGEVLHAEQVDAIGMSLHAREMGRAFLNSDQTGVGKGRALAAPVRIHLRRDPRNRVLYFTESAGINAPDVCRDLEAVGVLRDSRVAFLTTGSEYSWTEDDPVSGKKIERRLTSLTAAQRREVFESGAWPEDVDVIVTTYSQFNANEEDPRSNWIRNALDENVLVVLDEGHNALNPRSNTGRSIRSAIDVVGDSNVLYGTATPTRDPKGANLYTPLLPQVEEAQLDALLDNIASGGEIAQEAFATMLAADGVMIRRDHDLSNIEFRVALPDDERMLRYQAIMNRFSPMVEMMIDASSRIGEHVNRSAAVAYRTALARGLSEQAARAQTNELNQYSIALGSPLSNLARITMNAIKVDQTVDEVMQEIAEGRKPLITFHSTNAALLQEMSKGEDGKISEEAMEGATGLTLKDQIRRIHNSIYKVRLDSEVQDPRILYDDVREISIRIERAIDELPDDLPVSPVDALIERLEANNISVGEISGRVLCYRDGRIQRRTGRDRKATVDAFNGGDLDVLMYNAAGATGGSYHASPTFRDQRPRTMVEIEAPTDIIKYVQSQGRGNRYGQVHNPRVKSVMTGLTPEMRILQQRNRKLRSLGASVDGNRAHPLLLDDVPDLLNKVGDEATRNVLRSQPGLAHRLGFPEYARGADDVVEEIGRGADSGSGAGIGTGAEFLSNKVLTRSIMLSASEQDELVQRIVSEFDALIEELDSRNANPLKPKSLAGRVEILTTDIYSGQESETGDRSAFLAPLYISTGVHHIDENAINGEQVIDLVDKCRRNHGSDGFRPWAERMRQNLGEVLRLDLRSGIRMEDALANPEAAGRQFERAHNRATDLIHFLDNLVPGVSIRYPDFWTEGGHARGIVVGLIPPRNPALFDMPSAYRIDVIHPGSTKPERMSLSRLIPDAENISFAPGFSTSVNEHQMAEFDQQAMFTRQRPVQILHGNILQAISTASEHRLGSISLYRDQDGMIHRGVVVDPNKVSLEQLPVQIPSARVLAEVFWRHMEVGTGWLRALGSMGTTLPKDSDSADIMLSLTSRKLTFDMIPLRKSSYDWYAARPGLYEILMGSPMPQKSDLTSRGVRRGAVSAQTNGEITRAGVVNIDITSEEGKRRAYQALMCFTDTPIRVPGGKRQMVNEIIHNVDRLGAGDRAHEYQGEIVAPVQECAPVALQDPRGGVDVVNVEMAEIIDDTPVALAEPGVDDMNDVEWG